MSCFDVEYDQYRGFNDLMQSITSKANLNDASLCGGQAEHSGCCCEECTRTSRLIRPPNSGGNYSRWLDAATEGLVGEQQGAGHRSEAARQVWESSCLVL